MNIGIIGYGVIGSAVGNTFSSGKVFVYDINNVKEKRDNVFIQSSIREFLNQDMDLIFLCLPTPTVNGKFIMDSIVNCLDTIKSERTGDIASIALKSTVPPSNLEYLFEQYKDILNIYNPEFLRQNVAVQDLLDIEKHYVYADTDANLDVFKRYIENSDCNNEVIPFDSYQKLSLLKYSANSFNAMRVTFSNCMYQIFSNIEDSNMNFETFIEIFADFLEINKKRWGHNLRVPGPDGKLGYGGACLPKDVKALVEFSISKECEEAASFFNNIDEINTKIRKE